MNPADELKARINRLSVTDVPVPWFLDVDGVLNVIGPRPCAFDDWLHFERGPVGNGEGLVWPFVWAPDLMDCINLLVERKLISIRWLTTWEYDAPKYVAPALGLKVGGWVAETDDIPFLVGWWKLRGIKNHMNDDPGPFIWTDDEIYQHFDARQFVDFLPPEQGLVLMPSDLRGLTPAHLDTIITWLGELPGR